MSGKSSLSGWKATGHMVDLFEAVERKMAQSSHQSGQIVVITQFSSSSGRVHHFPFSMIALISVGVVRTDGVAVIGGTSSLVRS